MLTLAVDTTADSGSIALADEYCVRGEIELDAPRGFSMVLFAGIETLLGRQGVRLRDVDLFAAASGPGSFTGVRVGLAAIKGLAEVKGRGGNFESRSTGGVRAVTRPRHDHRRTPRRGLRSALRWRGKPNRAGDGGTVRAISGVAASARDRMDHRGFRVAAGSEEGRCAAGDRGRHCAHRNPAGHGGFGAGSCRRRCELRAAVRRRDSVERNVRAA